MHSAGTGKATWLLAAVLLVAGLAGGYAESSPAASRGNSATIVDELNLPQDKAAAALKLVDGFLAQIQDSGKDMLKLLSRKSPEQLLDPQVSAKIEQIQKAFVLKLERFHLDLSDIAGEDKAQRVVARFKAIVPQVLIGNGKLDGPAPAAEAQLPPAPASTAGPAAAAGAGGMAGMPGMSAAPAGTAAKPQEVPLGSPLPGGAGPALPNLDLQIAGDSASSSKGGMGGMMDMMSAMMKMMEPMMGMNNMAGMSNMPGPGNVAGMGMMGMGNMPGMNGGSSMANMSGMGGAGALNGELSRQLLSANALVSQLLAALSSQPGGATPAQLQTINQLLANQASLLQLLLSGAGGGSATAAGSMPSSNGMAGGMSGMGGM